MLGSPPLPGPTPLAALLGSLPETGMEIIETATDKLRPLAVWPSPAPIDSFRAQRVLPPGWLNEILSSYPSAAGRLSLPETYVRMNIVAKEMSPGGPAIKMLVKSNELDEAAPVYRLQGRRFLRPALDGTTPPPSPLMTWWLVLFVLSVLARYHPRAWVRAIDIDTSAGAVTLERAMRKAQDAVHSL